MKHIDHISFNTRRTNIFPLSLPVFHQPFALAFNKPVLIVAGDNGCGKSTLLEAIAYTLNLPTIGSYSTITDGTFNAARLLSDFITVRWQNKTPNGMFFRAEDYIGFVRSVNSLKDDLNSDIKEMEEYLRGEGLRRARNALRGQIMSSGAGIMETWNKNRMAKDFYRSSLHVSQAMAYMFWMSLRLHFRL